MLAKRPLPAQLASEVVLGKAVRPAWSNMPIFSTDESGYVISIEGLAWGVCRMLRTLFSEEEHVAAAETTASELIAGSGSWV